MNTDFDRVLSGLLRRPVVASYQAKDELPLPVLYNNYVEVGFKRYSPQVAYSQLLRGATWYYDQSLAYFMYSIAPALTYWYSLPALCVSLETMLTDRQWGNSYEIRFDPVRNLRNPLFASPAQVQLLVAPRGMPHIRSTQPGVNAQALKQKGYKVSFSTSGPGEKKYIAIAPLHATSMMTHIEPLEHAFGWLERGDPNSLIHNPASMPRKAKVPVAHICAHVNRNFSLWMFSVENKQVRVHKNVAYTLPVVMENFGHDGALYTGLTAPETIVWNAHIETDADGLEMVAINDKSILVTVTNFSPALNVNVDVRGQRSDGNTLDRYWSGAGRYAPGLNRTGGFAIPDSLMAVVGQVGSDTFGSLFMTRGSSQASLAAWVTSGNPDDSSLDCTLTAGVRMGAVTAFASTTIEARQHLNGHPAVVNIEDPMQGTIADASFYMHGGALGTANGALYGATVNMGVQREVPFQHGSTTVSKKVVPGPTPRVLAEDVEFIDAPVAVPKLALAGASPLSIDIDNPWSAEYLHTEGVCKREPFPETEPYRYWQDQIYNDADFTEVRGAAVCVPEGIREFYQPIPISRGDLHGPNGSTLFLGKKITGCTLAFEDVPTTYKTNQEEGYGVYTGNIVGQALRGRRSWLPFDIALLTVPDGTQWQGTATYTVGGLTRFWYDLVDAPGSRGSLALPRAVESPSYATKFERGTQQTVTGTSSQFAAWHDSLKDAAFDRWYTTPESNDNFLFLRRRLSHRMMGLWGSDPWAFAQCDFYWMNWHWAGNTPFAQRYAGSNAIDGYSFANNVATVPHFLYLDGTTVTCESFNEPMPSSDLLFRGAWTGENILQRTDVVDLLGLYHEARESGRWSDEYEEDHPDYLRQDVEGTITLDSTLKTTRVEVYVQFGFVNSHGSSDGNHPKESQLSTGYEQNDVDWVKYPSSFDPDNPQGETTGVDWVFRTGKAVAPHVRLSASIALRTEAEISTEISLQYDAHNLTFRPTVDRNMLAPAFAVFDVADWDGEVPLDGIKFPFPFGGAGGGIENPDSTKYGPPFAGAGEELCDGIKHFEYRTVVFSIAETQALLAGDSVERIIVWNWGTSPTYTAAAHTTSKVTFTLSLAAE